MEIQEQVSGDGKTIVKPLIAIDDNGNAKTGGLINNIGKGNAILIAGFSGPGLVGSISSNYIIEQMQMHQIAHIDSDFVAPSAIYIGGKLRHPFRIYADESGNLCVLTCDAPILKSGIRSVFDAVAKWAKRHRIKEIVTLEGIPFQGIPPEDRNPYVLSSTPAETTMSAENQASAKQISSGVLDALLPTTKKTSDNASTKSLDRHHIVAPVFYISGFPGALISACLSNAIACTAILIPAPSGIADPEGAAILIEELTKIQRIPVAVDTTYLRQKGEELRNQLRMVINSVRQQQENEKSMQMGEVGMYG
jgi:uncharacterized protein